MCLQRMYSLVVKFRVLYIVIKYNLLWKSKNSNKTDMFMNRMKLEQLLTLYRKYILSALKS